MKRRICQKCRMKRYVKYMVVIEYEFVSDYKIVCVDCFDKAITYGTYRYLESGEKGAFVKHEVTP